MALGDKLNKQQERRLYEMLGEAAEETAVSAEELSSTSWTGTVSHFLPQRPLMRRDDHGWKERPEHSDSL